MMTKSSFLGKLMLCLLCLQSINLLQAQQRPNESHFWDNVRFGGGLGVSFGNNFFSGTLSPSAIYQHNRYIATGVGLNFSYADANDNTLIAYGGSVLGLFTPIRELQVLAEFEQLNVNRDYDFNGQTYEENYWYPALFLGLGYRNGPVTFGVRYDVLYDEEKSIYASPFMPFVRVYF